MDIALQTILINTYNNNLELRQQAETALKEFLLTPNFLAAFFVVIDGYRGEDDNPTIHRDIRTAAAIVVKNNLRSIWLDILNNGKTHTLSVEERDFCKAKLLNILMKETDNTLRGLLAECVRIICETDYPDNWPALQPSIISQLQSPNILYVLNSLLILRKVIKRYEFKMKDGRKPADQLINSTFPIIQPMIIQIQDNNQIEASLILRYCVKIFWSYTLYALPLGPEGSAVDVKLWFDVLGKLFCKRLPEASEGIEPLGQPVNNDERMKWHWWKLKKWIGRTMCHFIQKYGNPRYCSEEYAPFANYFRSNYAIEWLNPIFTILHEYYSGSSKYITPDVQRNCITFISNCTEMSPSYKVIKPHLQFVLFNVIFPTICLRPEDLESFNNDPHEFLQRHHDPNEEWLDPRLASGNLLQTLAKYRQKDVMPLLLPFIQGVLSEYNNSPPEHKNHIKKDAVLVIIARIFKILSDSKTYAPLVEPFILHHVIPEFQSPVPLLRFRACWVVEYFTTLRFSTPGVVHSVTQGLLSRLRDPAMPVQAAAACSLRMMMESDETTEIIRPSLQNLIGEYFRIMDEIESDAVLSALQAIIEKFETDIYPMAAEMVAHLVRIFTQASQEGQEDEMSCFTAMQCLDTIQAVIQAVADDHEEVLQQMEPYLLPIIHRGLMDSDLGFEYADSLIHMIGALTYYCNRVSNGTWETLRVLMKALDEWAYDYLGDIMTPIINFMSRDMGLFLRYPYTQSESIVQALLRFIGVVFEKDTEDIERDSKIGANILTCLIINCKPLRSASLVPGAIFPNPDSLLPSILGLMLARLRTANTKRLRVKLLEILLAMLYYNTPATMELLGRDPAVRDELFTSLFDNVKGMEDTFSNRLIVLAFSNILSFELPSSQLQPLLQANLGAMLQQAIREIVFVEEEEAKETDGGVEGDDEDEDDDDNDFDDDEDVTDSRSRKETNAGSLENTVPDGGFDENDDCINPEDVAYQHMLSKIEKADRVKEELRRANGGDPFDDEEDDYAELTFQSPIEKTDLALYLLDSLQTGFSREPQLLQSIQQALDQRDTELLQQFMGSVEARRSKAAQTV